MTAGAYEDPQNIVLTDSAIPTRSPIAPPRPASRPSWPLHPTGSSSGAASGRFTANNATDTAISIVVQGGKDILSAARSHGHEALRALWFSATAGRSAQHPADQPGSSSPMRFGPLHHDRLHGWRYFALRGARGRTPRRLFPALRRHLLDLSRIDPSEQRGTLSFWLNNIPPRKRLPAF